MAASSPPQVGVPVDKASLNAKLGGATSSLRKANTALVELTEWAAPYTAQQLVDLYGFTVEEADLFLSALRGPTEAPALAATVDAFQFITRTWGN
jgi:hypothetical protein